MLKYASIRQFGPMGLVSTTDDQIPGYMSVMIAPGPIGSMVKLADGPGHRYPVRCYRRSSLLRKTFIGAANEALASIYARENGYQRGEWQYIRSGLAIAGVSGHAIILLKGWEKHSQSKDIGESLMAAMPHNSVTIHGS